MNLRTATISGLVIALLSLIPALTPEAHAARSRDNATGAFEVGNGETEMRAEILRQFYGSRTRPHSTEPVELQILGSEIRVSGPVDDVSRVESYLRLDGPRIPRLCTVRFRDASEVAAEIAPTQVAQAVENGYVAFPNDEEGTVYLVASDDETLDALEHRVQEVDYAYFAENGEAYRVENTETSWLDHVKFGGMVSFSYTHYKGFNGRHHDGYEAEAYVSAEYDSGDVRTGVTVGGRRGF